MPKIILYCMAVILEGGQYRAYLTDDETTFALGVTEFEAMRALVALMECEAYHDPE